MNPTTKKGQREIAKLRGKYRAELDTPQPGSLAWYDERGIEPPIAVPAPSRWRTQDALAMLSGALERQSDVRPYDAHTVRFLMQTATRMTVAIMRGTK